MWLLSVVQRRHLTQNDSVAVKNLRVLSVKHRIFFIGTVHKGENSYICEILHLHININVCEFFFVSRYS